MKISYAITVCDEFLEIQRLLSLLLNNKRRQDEVVVLVDLSKNKPTSELLRYLHELSSEDYITLVEDTFKGHFADWKNLLTKSCSGDYIFQIDADEYPNKELIETLPFLLEMNKDVDVMLVPRVNTVKGLTQDHIAKWRWSVNEKEWVNWPDYQWRIYKNDPTIKWVNKVHEKLEGFKQYATLPMEEGFALYHPKDIERQEKQNNYYSTL
jgi:glycosyltransferase involved in cell wall biosynthesis|tara:strand:+ start:4196 stop:4825 length:630 start_codon:yes stop_codon:yes gene_type:complete